jgi:aspartate racemase
MKIPLTIGIIGGMSPESTVTYYQRIVHRHQQEFNNHDYPRIVIASVSFQKYVKWQHEEAWQRISEELNGEFQAVASAGADFALLATNTMHKVLPQIQSPIPVFSILDAVSYFARLRGIKRIGLTGTRFTMRDGFYAKELEKRGLSVVLPEETEQEVIHNIIYKELIFGRIIQASVSKFIEIAQQLLEGGAEAILLGCTELELLIRDNTVQLNFIDSTKIHADLAWEISIGKLSFSHLGMC